MSFRLVPKSVTLNDLERRYSRWPLYCVISLKLFQHITTSICGGIYTESIVFCSACTMSSKRKSRSLSHLLMSILISVVVVFHFYSAAALLALGLGFGVKVRF